jgi:hypothetical protein
LGTVTFRTWYGKGDLVSCRKRLRSGYDRFLRPITTAELAEFGPMEQRP